MNCKTKSEFYVMKLMQLKIRAPRAVLDDYASLLQILNLVPYRQYCLPTAMSRDRNREADGQYLRHTIEIDQDDCFDFCGSPCSFLEMMVALCNRLDLEYMAYYADGSAAWDLFTQMLIAMGLSPDSSEQDIHAATDMVINRFYEANGRGGLFYIPEFNGDMRFLDIWSQAMVYIHDYVFA